MSGLKVFDDQKKLLLEIQKLTTPLSLIGAARGKFDLGDTRIDVVVHDINVDESGATNLEKIAKRKNAPPESSDEPVELPDITGKITVNLTGGTIGGPGMPTPVTIDPSTIVINIPDINKSIENNIALRYHTADGKRSEISVAGSISFAANGKVDLSKLRAQQKITTTDVNLAAAKPFIGVGEIAGLLNGSLDLAAEGLTGLSATGGFIVTDAVFAGGGIKDRLALAKIDIPVHVTRTVVDANTTLLKIE